MVEYGVFSAVIATENTTAFKMRGQIQIQVLFLGLWQAQTAYPWWVQH